MAGSFKKCVEKAQTIDDGRRIKSTVDDLRVSAAKLRADAEAAAKPKITAKTLRTVLAAIENLAEPPKTPGQAALILRRLPGGPELLGATIPEIFAAATLAEWLEIFEQIEAGKAAKGS